VKITNRVGAGAVWSGEGMLASPRVSNQLTLHYW
jgi:hypothetical protein